MSENNSTNFPLEIPKNIIDLTGQAFGRLHVTAYAGQDKSRQSTWHCRCDCGTEKIVRSVSLRKGITKSCGCFCKDFASTWTTKHGYSYTSEYKIYYSAKTRCQSVTCKTYKDYGGRGIEFRFNSFKEFINHIGKKPSSNHSLDRIDNDGHYEIGNVRWATQKQQSQNQRKTTILTVNEISKTVTEWSNETGVPKRTIATRIKRDGWCIECAVNLKKGRCLHKNTL